MLLEKRIPARYIARMIWRDALSVLFISTLVELLVDLNRSYLPPIPGALPAFLGTAISLLLSFKLNQSYDRWWEARKIWGAIVNDSRTLLRQAVSFASADPEAVERIGHRQIAWCYSLGQSLRGLDWRVGAEGHLSGEERDEAAKITNRPLAIMQMHAADLSRLARAGHLTDFQRVAMDETLTRLTASMGMAERIRSTVFPRTYRAFLHASIYLFIVLLSIALADVQGYWQIAITTLIAVPFFLLEKIARHMQDPFANRPTDTAVTAIARTIEINLLELLHADDVPEPLPPDGYYLM